MKRAWLAPEVIQSSAMDCGPASLKCLLDGLGVPVSYGRLREACQTDVDGTSIDTLEDIAVALGLDAEQVVIPIDHLLHRRAQALPALAVVRLPNGNTHFSVIWRRVGGWVQLMDPGAGRVWQRTRALLDRMYIHQMSVPAEDWREWAGSEEFLVVLRDQLGALGVSASALTRMVEQARRDEQFWGIATLDAATRMVTELVETGGLRRGPEATQAIIALRDRVLAEPDDALEIIQPAYWSGQPKPADDDDEDDDEPSIILRGVVIIRVRGVNPSTEARDDLPRDLAAALDERPERPGWTLLRTFAADGLGRPLLLLGALLMASAGTVLEVALFRGLVHLGSELGLLTQRLAAWGGLLVFALALLALESSLIHMLLAAGRRLEGRLRLAFLEKIPRLGARYFRSRLTSDMAERAHAMHHLRQLPALAGDGLRTLFSLVLTTAGIIWLDPSSTSMAIAGAALLVGLALAAQPALTERDLRFRSHAGVLGRVYHDALLGVVPIRTHGAALSVRREHERLLVEWMRTGLQLLRASVTVQGLQALVGFSLAIVLVSRHLATSGEIGATLLLVYWALRLPDLGQRIGDLARQYPGHRTRTLRLLEPLGAPDEEASLRRPAADAEAREPAAARSGGARIDYEGITVVAAGTTIVREVDLRIEPGSHLAIVGPSGAGKSSLIALLLGFHTPTEGTLRIDGVPLDGPDLTRLRRQTAWIDPAIQLWNRPLLDNLTYGTADPALEGLPLVLSQSDLIDVLANLPDGLQTQLGEGGAGLSGGEGQRVRVARAMLRPGVRLVILDEPLRGLDRGRRRALMTRLRQFWPEATLLCITHDVELTLDFPRVVVVDGGRVVEDGDPRALEAQADGAFFAMLKRERDVRERLWSHASWRRLQMAGGRVEERA